VDVVIHISTAPTTVISISIKIDMEIAVVIGPVEMWITGEEVAAPVSEQT
jgi:hypothetical protein